MEDEVHSKNVEVANIAKIEIERVQSLESSNINQRSLIVYLEEDVKRLKDVIHFGDDPLTTKVAVLNAKAEMIENRLLELEKHHTHAKLEASKAAWHLTITLIIAVSGWLIAIITKVSTSNLFEKVEKLFE